MATKTIKAKKAPVVKVKKKEVKKAPPKTVSVKKAAGKRKPLLIVTGDSCFWVNNGPSLCSLKDLRDTLLVMSEEQYIHHAGMGRNDFSSWVKDVLGDKKCAVGLLKAKNIKDALSAVEKSLKGYIA
jgi:hypothetical protein